MVSNDWLTERGEYVRGYRQAVVDIQALLEELANQQISDPKYNALMDARAELDEMIQSYDQR